MRLDDNHPDYFVDNEPTADQPTADNQPTGQAIDFSENTPEEVERPRHTMRKVLIWTATIGVLILALTFYFRYINPYATDARMTGYLVNVEKRGIIFKTYEAEMKPMTDFEAQGPYTRDVKFSVADPKVVSRLQQAQASMQPVTVVYEKFYGTLPWRGASKYVITEIKQP